MSDSITLAEVQGDLMRMFDRTDLVEIQATPRQLWSMACAVQLALRHPGFSGPSAEWATEAADLIFRKLAATEPLRRLAQEGYQADHDLPFGGAGVKA